MRLLDTPATWRPRAATTLAWVIGVALILPLTGGSSIARHSAQATVPLGNAASFGALSATAMTNAGLDTTVLANVGSSTSIDAGVTHPGFAAYGAGSAELANAQASLLTAYGNAEAQTPTGDITGMNLAGKSLTPGVYNSTGGILVGGPVPLTLNGGGNADSVFIFQAASAGDLTVDPTSNIVLTNGAQACHVFWKVQSAFLKNTGFTFVGTILALTQITLTDSITVQGRVLARNADVTFIHDQVVVPSTCTSQASIDAANAAAATAAAAAKAAADAAAAAKAAADATAKAAADAASAAKVAADIAAAKVAADAAAKAAADARAAAKAAAEAAHAADVKSAKAAAAAATRAARIAAAKAQTAKRAAAHAAATAKAKAKAKRAAAARKHILARPARHRFGFTG